MTEGRVDIRIMVDGQRGDGDVCADRPVSRQDARPHRVFRLHVHPCAEKPTVCSEHLGEGKGKTIDVFGSFGRSRERKNMVVY